MSSNLFGCHTTTGYRSMNPPPRKRPSLPVFPPQSSVLIEDWGTVKQLGLLIRYTWRHQKTHAADSDGLKENMCGGWGENMFSSVDEFTWRTEAFVLDHNIAVQLLHKRFNEATNGLTTHSTGANSLHSSAFIMQTESQMKTCTSTRNVTVVLYWTASCIADWQGWTMFCVCLMTRHLSKQCGSVSVHHVPLSQVSRKQCRPWNFNATAPQSSQCWIPRTIRQAFNTRARIEMIFLWHPHLHEANI